MDVKSVADLLFYVNFLLLYPRSGTNVTGGGMGGLLCHSNLNCVGLSWAGTTSCHCLEVKSVADLLFYVD